MFVKMMVITAGYVFAAALVAGAQQPPASAPAPPKAPAVQVTGLETPWDVRKILASLENDNRQLQPLLANLNPQQWYDEKGAPTTYILQWQMAQQQLNDVLTTCKLLSQKTDSLPLALDTYFRLEALEVTVRSVEEGAQKYADRAAAEKLSELIAHNFNSRERFRDYLGDLAKSIDQNFKIADEEAQRCRAALSKDPTASSAKRPKKQ